MTPLNKPNAQWLDRSLPDGGHISGADPDEGQLVQPESVSSLTNQSESPFNATESRELFLCDSRPWTRALSVQFLQESLPHIRVRGFSSIREATGCLSEGQEPAFLVFNIGTRSINDEEILECLDYAQSIFSQAPLVVLCDQENPDDVLVAIERGVQGYLPATTEPSVVVAAFHLIEHGGAFVPVALLKRALGRMGGRNDAADRRPIIRNSEFPPRQVEVLRLLCQGMSNKIIAHELQMKESTVKVHIRQIMRKLSASNRTEAALRASELFTRTTEPASGPQHFQAK